MIDGELEAVQGELWRKKYVPCNSWNNCSHAKKALVESIPYNEGATARE
jgi:hypothetical protein